MLGLFAVSGTCCHVRLQHAFTDTLAAVHHGCVCNSWHCHVLWGWAVGRCSSKRCRFGNTADSAVKFSGDFLLSLSVIWYNWMYSFFILQQLFMLNTIVTIIKVEAGVQMDVSRTAKVLKIPLRSRALYFATLTKPRNYRAWILILYNL